MVTVFIDTKSTFAPNKNSIYYRTKISDKNGNLIFTIQSTLGKTIFKLDSKGDRPHSSSRLVVEFDNTNEIDNLIAEVNSFLMKLDPSAYPRGVLPEIVLPVSTGSDGRNRYTFALKNDPDPKNDKLKYNIFNVRNGVQLDVKATLDNYHTYIPAGSMVNIEFSITVGFITGKLRLAFLAKNIIVKPAVKKMTKIPPNILKQMEMSDDDEEEPEMSKEPEITEELSELEL